jgi:hypothetical protein
VDATNGWGSDATELMRFRAELVARRYYDSGVLKPRRRRGAKWYAGTVFLCLLLAIDLWFIWAAASKAWSIAQADRGSHGTFTASQCTVDTFTSEPITTKNGQHGGRTTYQYLCQGKFVADAGWTRVNVAVEASRPVANGLDVRAVIADRGSATAYSEGGSYAKYVVVAILFAVLPLVVVFAARRRPSTAERGRTPGGAS